MPRRFSKFLLCLILVTGIYSMAHAATTTLFLLNGTIVRGEIVSRTPKNVQLKTPSGLVKVRTATLMPISRQQLRLPEVVDKDSEETPEMDLVIAQMEKLVAENEALKLELVKMKDQLAKAGITVANGESAVPAEGPKSKR